MRNPLPPSPPRKKASQLGDSLLLRMLPRYTDRWKEHMGIRLNSYVIVEVCFPFGTSSLWMLQFAPFWVRKNVKKNPHGCCVCPKGEPSYMLLEIPDGFPVK